MRLIARCSLLAGLCWHMAAHAGDGLPSHLAGTWGTAASLYEGSIGQSHMYLLEDGRGALLGSTPPGKRADGIDDGKPGPRALIGFPIRTTLDGDSLFAQAISPDGKQAEEYAKARFTCQYSAAQPTLTCKMPRGEELVLSRQSDTVAAEVASMIEALR